MNVIAANAEHDREEILIVAPIGQDAALLRAALAREGLAAATYGGIEALCERMRGEAGAILVAEEALSAPEIERLRHALAAQEPWSDIPIIVMTGNGEATLSSLRVLRAFAPSGAVTLLERPFRAITLVSTLQVALRARKRQYQVRELLELQIQATRIRDEFISIASHELKTPLTSLKLQTQLNKRVQARDPGAFSPLVSRLIDGTDSQVDRLTRLVEDMLDVSRIHSGKLLMEKSRFDLAELVADVVPNFSAQLAAAGCALVIERSGPVIGTWDRYRIEQVLNNLLTNAIRYAPGAPIEISVARDDARGIARLRVRDHGPGIAPADHERIFARFERAVVGRGISGLGLGLYICRQIVASHAGTIRVESDVGRGAGFVIELKLAP
jgi:signal transduction histidine kinase